MSFTKEKRETIKRYILEKINERCPDTAKRTAESFHVSLNTVYRYIRELEEKKLIKKAGETYFLAQIIKFFPLLRSKNELVNEDLIYDAYIKEYVNGFPDNVQRIWEYSFMEMMNNAIDHSGAETVGIGICKDCINTKIMVSDNGVGIFRKIKEFYNYNTLEDAVNELFKGKLTTDKNNHSGEGIFFTSRVLDDFKAISDGKIFTHNKFEEKTNNMDDIKEFKSFKNISGTTIYMELSNYSNKTMQEVFDMFSDIDHGFVKTRIPIKNIYETYPVSRSQAKRLYHGFEKFQEVELDFENIAEIGQGFAHELFVVFPRQHEGIKLIPVNTSEEVKKMINHVMNTTI